MAANNKFEYKFVPGLPLEKSAYPGLNEHSYVLKKAAFRKKVQCLWQLMFW